MPLFFLGIPLSVFFVVLVGSLIAQQGIPWYQTLLLPVWTPSGSLIGLAWALNYLLCVLSLFLVWMHIEHASSRFRVTLILFGLNACLFLLGCTLLFWFHDLSGAVIVSGLLAGSIIAIMAAVWSAERHAALLLIPYAAWVILVTAVLFETTKLNV